MRNIAQATKSRDEIELAEKYRPQRRDISRTMMTCRLKAKETMDIDAEDIKTEVMQTEDQDQGVANDNM